MFGQENVIQVLRKEVSHRMNVRNRLTEADNLIAAGRLDDAERLLCKMGELSTSRSSDIESRLQQINDKRQGASSAAAT
jgi:hypothetical protein